MKRALLISILAGWTQFASALSFTNEINILGNWTSYDGDQMRGLDPLATYFHNTYPQYTNHIYSYGRGGEAWDGDVQFILGKRCLPLLNSFPLPAYHFVGANDNGSLDSNATATAGIQMSWLPPTNYNSLAAAFTNEGIAMPKVMFVPLGRPPHDSQDGDSGAIVGNAGSMGLAAALGVPVIDLWHNMYTPAFTNDQAGARILWSTNGGSHFSQAGYLAMDLFVLQGLGVKTNLMLLTINFQAATATTNGCTVSGLSLSGNTLSGTFHGDTMPMAWDVPGNWSGQQIDYDARGCFTVYPQLLNAMFYVVKITNFPTAGTYSLTMDGVVMDTATDVQWAAGRNWFTNFNGWLGDQRTAVLGLVRDQAGVDRRTLISHNAGSKGTLGVGDMDNFESAAGNSTEVYPGAFTGSNYITHMATPVSELRQYAPPIHNAAQQTNHSFAVAYIPPPPPRFAPAFVSGQTPGKVFHFAFKKPLTNCWLESSTDLKHWQVRDDFMVTNNEWLIVDTGPQQFYRVGGNPL